MIRRSLTICFPLDEPILFIDVLFDGIASFKVNTMVVIVITYVVYRRSEQYSGVVRLVALGLFW